MKITMLGTTGSGKTVYMSAMSELFFNSDFEGYKLTNRDSSIDSSAFVFSGFHEINSLYDDGTFPYGTTSSIIMPLEFKYGDDHVIDIDWIDYRGQAITELAKGADNPENAGVLATLLASDVVIVFVDAVILKATNSIITARKRVGANEISQILSRVHKEKHFDLMFLLTKTDSDTIALEDDLPYLTGRVGELYSSFLSETGTNIQQYFVIPVGALGKGNVKSTRTEISTDRGGKLIKYEHTVLVPADELKPFNIASSFARALLLALESETKNKNTSVRIISEKLDTLRENFGPIRNLIDILFGSKKRIEINELERKLRESQAEIRALKPHRAMLERIARSSQ